MNSISTEKEASSTTVSKEVLHKVARLTTLSVNGVSRMANFQGKLEKIIGKEEYKGVKVHLKDDQVFIDLYVILISERNVRDISREIQARVSRAISQMIGMDVGGVNIHIMDIDFSA